MRHLILFLALLATAARAILHFDLHGSYCGAFGTQACAKESAISATPFAFK